jgi:hypothetical protein
MIARADKLASPHPGNGMGKCQVKVSESLFDSVDLTYKALALPPIVFCRKGGPPTPRSVQ